ncbi:endonuclease/exonuclease/phosphatase family protein [Bailinhaonella thermotolerans]|uniref:Endonuclease/exonuclease/phosphatase family protein n=1 Tax=Bailinhaonella thermotolerans TaxID=1070861 RepID=A0A3A4AVL1_9ACTN|nr:endonuclease/exonuclease/phosphatase family protein [Bailinhaonella thermotolerans]
MSRGLLAWALVGPVAAFAVLRAGGLERGNPLVVLVSFTPYAAVLAPAGVLVAVWARSRAAVIAGVVAALALAACVVPRMFGTEARPGVPVRVMTANLLFGRADPAALVDLVRRSRPDFLSLQELPPDAVARLDAAGLGGLLPYRVYHAGEGPDGSAIYARHPLRELKGLFTPVGHNMPAARAEVPGAGPVDIIAVHPAPPLPGARWADGLRSLPPATRAAPPAAMAGRGSAAPGGAVPRILAGDFNASLDHALLRSLLATGYRDAARDAGQGLTPTWPANRRLPPLFTIDHILADRHFTTASAEVHTIPGTDHRPVTATLHLTPPP